MAVEPVLAMLYVVPGNRGGAIHDAVTCPTRDPNSVTARFFPRTVIVPGFIPVMSSGRLIDADFVGRKAGFAAAVVSTRQLPGET
jgi:hypothetical protein